MTPMPSERDKARPPFGCLIAGTVLGAMVLSPLMATSDPYDAIMGVVIGGTLGCIVGMIGARILSNRVQRWAIGATIVLLGLPFVVRAIRFWIGLTSTF